MKTTKEDLIKENATLSKKVEEFGDKDRALRVELGELLDIYHRPNAFQYQDRDEIPSWYKIAYMIGELKSDADFSCVLAGRNMLREENERLKLFISEQGLLLPVKKNED